MSIERGLYERLLGVTQLGGRVYPLTLPQGPTYPAAVYQVVVSQRVSQQRGTSLLEQATVQVDLLARTHAELLELREAVHQRLHGYRGPWGPGTCVGALPDAERDGPYEDAPERSLYRKSLDYRIHYQPA